MINQNLIRHTIDLARSQAMEQSDLIDKKCNKLIKNSYKLALKVNNIDKEYLSCSAKTIEGARIL